MFGFGLSAYVAQAKAFIQECLAECVKEDHARDDLLLEDFIPSRETIQQIASHCRRVGLSPADCGISLVDVGYDYQRGIGQGVMESIRKEAVSEMVDRCFEAGNESRRKMHERLLEKAFQIGTTRYRTKVVPRHGEFGAAISEAMRGFLKSTEPGK